MSRYPANRHIQEIVSIKKMNIIYCKLYILILSFPHLTKIDQILWLVSLFYIHSDIDNGT